MPMRASWIAWSTAVVAAVVWACGGSDGGGGTAPPTTGTVSGQVSLGGTGVGGIPVHLRASGAGTDAKPVQTTGAGGGYTFTAVAPGEYRVFIDVPDTMAAEPGPAEDTVAVVAGETSTATTFALRLLVGSVEGTVTDTAGVALADRSVFLRKDGSTTDRAATTSASGVYTFSNVVVGDYTVRVQLACGEPDPGSVAATVMDGMKATPATIQVTPRPSDLLLTCDVQPIFTNNCAFSGCHGGSSPQLGLNLSSPQNVKNTAINVESSERPGVDRIEPFNSDTAASYLVCKIVEVCPGRQLARMPADGPPFLSAAQIDTIRTWIDQGAQDVP